MTNRTETRYRRELNSFFAVTLLNVVIAAQAVGLALAYVVASVLGTTGVPTPALRALAGALALVCFGLGLAWLCSSARVLRGVAHVRRPFRRRAGPVSDEILTAGIVGMISHYRENRATIRTMILVCTVGGFLFLVQGVVSTVKVPSLNLPGGSVVVNMVALLPSALLTVGIGLVSLLSSYYFSRFSRVWDLRLEETARAEERLKSAMRMDRE